MNFYEDTSRAKSEKLTNLTILCGDFNAKTGKTINTSEHVLRNHGSENRDDRGEIIVNFMLKNLYLN